MFKSLSKKARTNNGMTMAEMLITVAIIVILAGVAFIAILSYQRNMALFERDKIAKEIFIAAQNHLTVAKGQDYPGCSSDFTEKNGSSTEDDDAKYAGTRKVDQIDPSDTKEEPYYYIIVNSGDLYKNPDNNGYYMLNSMLPDGSVEDKVRIGGDYIIRYQPKTGRILDVFYTTSPPENYSLDDGFKPEDFDGLMKDHSKDTRKNYGSKKDAVVGYYGGAHLTSLGCEINTPDIDIENSDKLSAKVYWEPNSELMSGLNLNSDIKMTIAIKGNQSGAEVSDLMSEPNGVAGGLNGAPAPSGMTNPLGAANRLSAANVLTNLGVVPLNAIRNTLLGAGEDTEKDPFASYVLDDITDKDKHFARKINKLVTDAGGTTKFIPGEDITVKIIIQSTEYLGMAESETVLTNSLFDSISNGKSNEDDSDYKYTNKSTITISDTSIAPSTTTTDTAPDTAYISCIRHLENLDATVSNFDAYDVTNKLKIGKAIQKKDIKWNASTYSKITYAPEAAGSVLEFNPINETNEKFKPVLMKNAFIYNGKKHSIKDVDVEYNGNAGLFGSTKDGSIKNLKLVDFSIVSKATGDTGNAGMLAGKLVGTTVTNVIGITKSDGKVKSEVVTGRNAGGLVGSMTAANGANGAKIEYSAAAVRVNGSLNAGGLVGSVSGNSEINGCYSGGHTKEGSYTKLKDSNNNIMYDVVSAHTAGGLVGNVDGSTIADSYSTCSVNGVGTAGGFVGTSTGTIKDSYCTGLVNGGEDATNKHAFIGNGTASSGNKYYAIINTTGSGKDLKEMEPGGGTDNNGANKVKAFDENTQTFANFAQAGIKSYPYDKGQQGLKGKFIFKVIPDSSNYFVHEHYGDWPQPEVFVINN